MKFLTNLLQINKVPKLQRVTMISLIMKGSNIIAVGRNRKDRKSYRFKNMNGYSNYAGIHAEMDAIRKCTKKQLHDSTILVIGVNTSSGNYVKSKPCRPCMEAIKGVGVKKVVYYDKNCVKFSMKVV